MTVRPEPVASSTGAGTKSKSKRKRSKPDDQKKAMIKEAHRLDKLRMNMRAKQLHVFVGNVSGILIFSSVVNELTSYMFTDSACND